jgi:hypothetical protein
MALRGEQQRQQQLRYPQITQIKGNSTATARGDLALADAVQVSAVSEISGSAVAVAVRICVI